MNAGDLALLNYGERPTLWHTRVLLAPTTDDNWVVLTSDYDLYEEQMSINNPDLTGFHLCGQDGAIPSRINPANVYSFVPMTPQELRGYMHQGQLEAQRILGIGGGAIGEVGAQAGAPVIGQGAAAAGPPVANAAPDLDTWIAVEEGHTYKKGAVVASDPSPLPAGCVVLGEKGIILDGGQPVFVQKIAAANISRHRLEDLRVLPVAFDGQGIRRREFSSAVALMTDDPPMGGGLQLTGPGSALRLLKDLRDQSFTVGTFHEHWLRTAEIPKGDRSTYEHECLSRIMDAMVMVDQLNVPALQSAELIFRRLQVIRQAHRASPGNPDYSSADYYMGWKFKRAGLGVDSDLSAFVATELKNEAAILKESRKAKEEQEARRRGKGKKTGPADGGQAS